MPHNDTPEQEGWFYRHFKAHPRTVGECYFRHLWFSLRTGGLMVFYAACLILHGLLPCFCEKTASNYVQRLYDEMAARKQKTGCDGPA